MPFSENSMGQVRTIWDFCRLNVMATLKYRISEFLGGFFFFINIVKPHCFLQEREKKVNYLYWMRYCNIYKMPILVSSFLHFL